MYILKSNFTGLFVADYSGLMTSKQNLAMKFIDKAAAKLYMAKKGLSIQYYDLVKLDMPVKDMKDDIINHPNHYTAYSREVIDTMQGDMTSEEFTGYLKGNIIKYISRYQGKNGVQDLEKAQWYLNKLHDTVKDMKDEHKPKSHPFIKVSAEEL